MPSQVSPTIPGNEVKEVVAPGRGLTEVARALGGARRRAGIFPYQWLYPGPNSRHVLAHNSIEYVDGDATYTILSFRVEEGLRFSLRGVVFASTQPTWNQGSNDVVFDLNVTGVGPRPVDFLTNVRHQLGSLNEPWPILGRLEFQSRDVLEVTVTLNNGVGDDGGFGIAMLVGHTYPNSEAGEG